MCEGIRQERKQVMSTTSISFLDGESKIKIGHEVSINSQDTEQWVSLMGYNIQVVNLNGQLSFAVYQEDEWNYDSKNLLFTIQQEVRA